MTTPSNIIVIGAGISGLTLALHLHARGYSNVKIYESSKSLKPLGVGLTLQPSAVLILRNLGLLPELEELAISCRELLFFNQYGNKILGEPRGVAAGYEVPQLSIHRGELQMLLLRAVKQRLGEDAVSQDHTLQSVEQNDDSTTATFSRAVGESITVRGSMLIGADGINSRMREIKFPDEGPPKFSGRMLWRGCCEGKPFLSGASQIMAGHARQFFLAYPISNSLASEGRQLINWVCCQRTRSEDDPDTTPPEKTSWTLEADREPLVEAFKTWSFGFLSVPDLIKTTQPVWVFPMSDRDPIPAWTDQRTTLMGDAAHPMLPIGGNGATQSILDAESLAKHICSSDDVSAALKAYERERLPVTSNIVLANRGKSNNEYVMELVHQRAPSGFDDIDNVVSREELASFSEKYKQMTGADKARVNKLAKETAT